MATNFLFPKFRFFRRNSKTTPDTHMVPGKENVGNFVFCRMAPSAMTSGDPECQHCFRFVLLLSVRFAQKLRDHFFLQLVVLPELMTAAKLGCYSSSDVATGTNFCHFRTFSIRTCRYFVMLSFHSSDLLYSSGLVVESFRIVELLRI